MSLIVENITDDMRDDEGSTWYSVIDGMSMYRVKNSQRNGWEAYHQDDMTVVEDWGTALQLINAAIEFKKGE